MTPVTKRMVVLLIAVFSLSLLFGCAGREFAPKNPYMYWYYHKELPEADRAVEAARQAGKDKQCPAEFKEAADLRDKAYEVYAACRTQEAIGLAVQAAQKAKALCPPPPPPPPAATPTPAPPPPPPAKVIDKITLMVHFDFDKSDIKKSDEAELKKGIDFVKKYPGSKVRVDGHTDSIGTDQYNQKLSERRAEAVKNYLVQKGAVDASKITSMGHGETKPIASNKTKEGRAQNRRVEILILSD